MAELNLEEVIKSGVERALNTPIVNGKTITEWAAIGMKSSPNWVSVNDRLPEICEPVLFIGKNYYGNWYLIQKGWYDGEAWHRDGDYKDFSEHVAYWMSLPKPPKEEET